jgi:transcriptional regulator GlxA family with amidase domain
MLRTPIPTTKLRKQTRSETKKEKTTKMVIIMRKNIEHELDLEEVICHIGLVA